MKHFFIFAVLAFAGSGASSFSDNKDVLSTGFIESIINGTINGILSNISDPISIPSIALDFSQLNSSLLTGKADISKLSIAGIKSLVASFIKVDLISLQLNMTIDIPELDLSAEYDADVNVASLVPLYGGGLASVLLKGMQLQIDGRANLSPLSVKNVSVLLTMDQKTDFNFKGLLNNTEFTILVNQMLNDNFVPFINNNKALIGGLISGIAETVLNSILGGKKSTDQIYEDSLRAVRDSKFGQNKFIILN